VANQALSKSEARLALALKASELGLWDWNLQTDEVHHTQIRSCSAWSRIRHGHARHLKPRLHPTTCLAQACLVEHLKGRTEDYQSNTACAMATATGCGSKTAAARWSACPAVVVRMLGTRRDISASKALEEQQRLAATVFEAASEGIVILDPDYALIAVNQAFSRVTGYDIEDMLGRNVVELPCSRDARRHFGDPPGAGAARHLAGRTGGNPQERRAVPAVAATQRGARCAERSAISSASSPIFRRGANPRSACATSHYDELTGLANRALFRERLHEPISACARAGAAWRCCTSTWTASSCSTTAWAMKSPTSCCKRWPGG
jgi:PAS domain-containing protein